MITEYLRYKGIKVLHHFLGHPTTKVHLNQLARDLAISPASAKTHCDLLEKEGLLKTERVGNAKLFSLDNDSPYAKQLKKTHVLLELKEGGVEKTYKGCLAVALIGSRAKGEHDETSDTDLLRITRTKNAPKEGVEALQKSTSSEVQVTDIPYYDWEKRKERGDAFAKETLQHHILLYGEEL